MNKRTITKDEYRQAKLFIADIQAVVNALRKNGLDADAINEILRKHNEQDVTIQAHRTIHLWEKAIREIESVTVEDD